MTRKILRVMLLGAVLGILSSGCGAMQHATPPAPPAPPAHPAR